MTRLLFTVSGGLEHFAENQVRSCFPSLLKLDWRRGPSGSQLYITLPPLNNFEVDHQIAEAIQKLDYVEYVSMLIEDNDKTDIDQGETLPVLLKKVETKAASIDLSSVEFCKRICDSLATKCDVGLDGLPGILIPTPDICSDSCFTNVVAITSQNLGINTIYTNSNVAKVVVETIKQFLNLPMEKTLWLDAGAGNGALLDHLPSKTSFGIDTNPMSEKVRKMDFFEVSTNFLKGVFGNDSNFLCVVSNPPFSLSSRGDYTPIVQFINHAFDNLQADFVAVICPSKFARVRIWKSLNMTDNARLMGRFFLPQNAFFNPTTGQTINILSYCLIFGNKTDESKSEGNQMGAIARSGIYLSAKRNKGIFPNLHTSDLTKSIAQGLTKAGLNLSPERSARYILSAKLSDSSSLEFLWLLNHQSPCSLHSSNSIKVSNHSLGSMSLSCKPPIALAMASLVLNKNEKDPNNIKKRVAINLMAGEGTIELEASRAAQHSFFLLCGDKSFDNCLKTQQRLKSLKQSHGHHCLVDIIAWDAQHLPIRRGIADAITADLPFQGQVKVERKTHQTPFIGKATQGKDKVELSYNLVLGHVARVLKPAGRVALLSPDFEALRHACRPTECTSMRLQPYFFGNTKMAVGGLSAKLFLYERQLACTKDISLWVASSTPDISSWILNKANEACIKKAQDKDGALIVTKVNLHTTYFNKEKQSLSHCYRMTFDDLIRNVQAKQFEQDIRECIKANLLDGMSLR